MNPQDPLANLHPLREPGLIGWWPPAPGWWLLLVLGAAALLVLVFFLARRYRANAYRRHALRQLQSLHADYRVHGDAGSYLAGANALLKSVALVAYPRRDVAASSGDPWLLFLNSTARGAAQFDLAFVTGAYRKTVPQLDLESAQRCAIAWIKHHEVTP